MRLCSSGGGCTNFVIVPNVRRVLNRNYNSMRPLFFRSDELRSLLLRSKIATLDELKQALGTSVDVTVFRKLKPLDYLTSYSHRGRYYTLREVARFDEKGLWSHAPAWFSQAGTLLSTAESFVNRSPRGFFADELARALHVDVQDALHQLAQQRRVPSRSFPVYICTRPSTAPSSRGNFLRAAMWRPFPHLWMPPCRKSRRKS